MKRNEKVFFITFVNGLNFKIRNELTLHYLNKLECFFTQLLMVVASCLNEECLVYSVLSERRKV